jgi:hypothetical protein
MQGIFNSVGKEVVKGISKSNHQGGSGESEDLYEVSLLLSIM